MLSEEQTQKLQNARKAYEKKEQALIAEITAGDPSKIAEAYETLGHTTEVIGYPPEAQTTPAKSQEPVRVGVEDIDSVLAFWGQHLADKEGKFLENFRKSSPRTLSAVSTTLRSVSRESRPALVKFLDHVDEIPVVSGAHQVVREFGSGYGFYLGAMKLVGLVTSLWG